MDAKGYMGNILRINVTDRSVHREPLGEKMCRSYIGGAGLGSKILYEETDERTDPLSPENKMIFATGPITGTKAFNSNRFTVVSKSPQTGIFAQSSAGGYWGGQLKQCGYDAVIIEGKADRPVYIDIGEEKVDILDAGHVWGKDTFAATEELVSRYGKGAKAAVIGPAGENQIRIANIVTDGYHGRVVGRCGMGAVMGSKNVKAIVVHGSKEVPVADPGRLSELIKSNAKSMKDGTKPLQDGGTSVGLDFCEEIGNLPVRNWYQGSWPDGAKKITGLTLAKEYLTDRYHCGQCPVNCGRIVKSVRGPYEGREIAGPEYESSAILGANCLIDDLPTIISANELCNRYGLDTISTGSAIAFAFEAKERGLLGRDETDGIDIDWGNGEAQLALIEKIGRGEGLGKILGEGVKSASKHIGGTAREFAVHVKGLEPPAHDPRARFTQGLGFATSNRGACHLSAFSMDFEGGGVIDDLGAPALSDRFNTKDKGENIFRMQNLMCMFDSAVCCKFVLFGGITVNPLIEFINAVTGWQMDHQEFSDTGDRIFNLGRLYNVRLGISRSDDTLPPRLLTHRRGGGTNHLPLLNVMLSDYYMHRGWDEFGIPTGKKLSELGLQDYGTSLNR